MNIVRIKGGFGNQLFQYCFANYILKQCKKPVYLDIYSLEQDENRKLEIEFLLEKNKKIKLLNRYETIFFRMARKIKLFKTFREEKLFLFHNIQQCDKTIFDGYWQNLNYINIEIIKFIKSSLLEKATKPIKDYGSTLAIHMRFGDYVGNKLHQVVDLSYYDRALNMIDEYMDIIVVTDDKIIADNFMKKLADKYNFKYRFANNTRMLDDFLEIGLSKKRIIPNSTFSYWACLLFNSKDTITCCPSKWLNLDLDYSGLIPPQWEIIDV
jgi:hypothetical protein